MSLKTEPELLELERRLYTTVIRANRLAGGKKHGNLQRFVRLFLVGSTT